MLSNPLKSTFSSRLSLLGLVLVSSTALARYTPMFLHDHDVTRLSANGINNYGELIGTAHGRKVIFSPGIDNEGQVVWHLDANEDGINDFFRDISGPETSSLGVPNDLLHAVCQTSDGPCLWNGVNESIVQHIPIGPYSVSGSTKKQLSNFNAIPGYRPQFDSSGASSHRDIAFWQNVWVNIGKLPGWDLGGAATVVNDQGWVAGYVRRDHSPGLPGDPSYTEYTGFIYKDGAFTEIEGLWGTDTRGFRQTRILDMNVHGEVVGWSHADDGDPDTHNDPKKVFLWLPERKYGRRAGIHELEMVYKFRNFPGLSTLSINDKGQIAGTMAGDEIFNSNGTSAGFLPTGFVWLPEEDYGLSQGLHDSYYMGSSLGVNFFKIYDINNEGVMIGNTWDGSTYDVGLLVPSDYVPPEPAPQPGTGIIKGNVSTLAQMTTADDIKVHHARVELYDQNGLRPRDQGNTEGDEAYLQYVKEFSENFTRFSHIGTIDINPDDIGTFQFKGIPIQAPEATATGSTVPVNRYYMLRVTSAETSEVDLENCLPGIPLDECPTITTPFLDYLLPGQNPLNEPDLVSLEINLTPMPGTQAKLDLIDAITAIGPHHYGEIEVQAAAWVNGTFEFDYQIDALKRARWSEIAVRDAAQQSQVVMKIMLGGLANLAGDIFDEFYDGTRKDFAKRKKEKAAIEAKGGNVHPSLVPQGLSYKEYAERMNLDAAMDRAEVVSKVISAIEKAVEKYKLSLTSSGKDTSSVDKVELALKTIKATVEKQTIRGAAGPILKKLIQDAIKNAEPLLFDGNEDKTPANCEDFTYTGLTCAHLRYSVERMQSWSEQDFLNGNYKSDRKHTIDTINNMGGESAALIQSMFYVIAATEAVGKAEGIYDKFGKVAKPVKVAALISKFAKYAGNSSTVALPAYFIYATLPEYVKNGVYQAYGEPAPQ